MNLFILDEDPTVAATYHCDKHVVKMILETAQLLSTAHRVLDGYMYIELTSKGRKIKRWLLNDSRETSLYKATHVNHPSNVWIRESSGNYYWAFNLMVNLLNEFQYRFKKTHKCSTLLPLLYQLPTNIPNKGRTHFTVAINEEIYGKVDRSNPINAYRKYYKQKNETQFKMKWTDRTQPGFML